MNPSLFVSVLSVLVVLTFSYLNYRRDTSNDKKVEHEKDQTDVATLVRESMSALNTQLKEIRTDIKDIKEDIKKSEISLASHEEQLHTLFKNFYDLKKEVEEIERELRQIGKGS